MSTMPVIAQVTGTIRSPEMQKQLSTMLPPSINIDKFTEVAIQAISSSPEVLEADKDSLYRACVASARRGLLPDKKEGAFIVFNSNVGTRDRPQYMKMVQFLPMVEGIIKEMTKAGIRAYAVSVYANDAIRFWNDDAGQHVMHEPMVFGDRGEMVGVFAAATTADGRPYVEAMSIADVMRIAAKSKQCRLNNDASVALGGTWKTDFERMSQKSPLHRLRKRLGIADDLEEMTDIDLAATTPVAETAPPAAVSEAAIDPSSPLSTQQALPAPQENPLKQARRPRRSRVLEGVKATLSQAPATAEPPRETVEQPKPAKQSEPAPQEPYNEEDVL